MGAENASRLAPMNARATNADIQRAPRHRARMWATAKPERIAQATMAR